MALISPTRAFRIIEDSVKDETDVTKLADLYVQIMTLQKEIVNKMKELENENSR